MLGQVEHQSRQQHPVYIDWYEVVRFHMLQFSVNRCKQHEKQPNNGQKRWDTLPARAFTAAPISVRPLEWESLTTGTMRPLGVCTAMLMSMLWYCRMKSPCHEELTPGTFFNACSHIKYKVMATQFVVFHLPIMHAMEETGKRLVPTVATPS